MTKKVALITGASSGVGKETSLLLLKQGYIVYGVARRTDELEYLKSLGGHALYIDMSNDESMITCVETIVTNHGRIDILINSAGYAIFGSLEDCSIELAKQQFQVNLFGLARLIQLVTPYMRKQKFGKIINVSGICGEMYQPFNAWYNASKFALEGLSDNLRFEVQPFGIDVILVQPGFINTTFSKKAFNHINELPKLSAYKGSYEKMLTYSSKTKNGGSSPYVVAKIILKALCSNTPCARYAVGSMAKPMLFINNVLPDKWIDIVYRKVIGL